MKYRTYKGRTTFIPNVQEERDRDLEIHLEKTINDRASPYTLSKLLFRDIVKETRRAGWDLNAPRFAEPSESDVKRAFSAEHLEVLSGPEHPYTPTPTKGQRRKRRTKK